MDIIGHRGCGEQCPENTVLAMSRATRHLTSVEMDVRRCGSEELVVFHDEEVDRVTDASGRVSDLSWAELSELDVHGSGEGIPRLAEALDSLRSGARVQIELKETGITADVRDAVEGRDLDVSVSSFLPAALAEVRDLDWSVSTGYLFGDDPAANLETALDLGCSTVHPHYDLCLRTDVVDAAHAEGLRVVAWKAARTVDEIEAIRETGVDGVTADRWDIARRDEATPAEDGRP